MSKKAYDTLKWISLVLPIIITATISLQVLLGFSPMVAEIMGVIETAILGILKIDSELFFMDKDIVDKEQ